LRQKVATKGCDKRLRQRVATNSYTINGRGGRPEF